MLYIKGILIGRKEVSEVKSVFIDDPRVNASKPKPFSFLH